MVKRKEITLDESLDTEVAKLEEDDLAVPVVKAPTPRTRCNVCGEDFEGTSTDHYLAKHAPQ